MTDTPDPRVTAARGDIAAENLRGRVTAARFVEGETRVVMDAQAPLRLEPSSGAPLATEALMGERVTIYDTNDEGWCWGQLESDGYVGWLPAGALAPPGPQPTHKVCALRTFVFPGPSIKLTPVAAPPFGAVVTIAQMGPPFAVTAAGGFIPIPHVVALAERLADFVAVAERFVGTPYLWGGKTNFGIDCSGLVQVALSACGIRCPRDSDMQERAVGEIVAGGDVSSLRRGDLVFWKGHVAIARNAAEIIHANAFHMSVASEPISDAIVRIRAQGSDITAIKRVSPQ